jgi:hypothetical protein
MAMSRVRGKSCKKVEQADRYRDESCKGEVVVVEDRLELDGGRVLPFCARCCGSETV